MNIVDFLDVTLDLERDKFSPYMKTNNILEYVNVKSNHPPSITKNIPESVNKRLNNLSADEHTFSQAIPPYQEALDKAGHKFKLHFVPPQDQPQRRRRKQRKIIWYNPPYCSSVKTNIGKEFFKILKQCFPKENPLSKILNQNSVKLSYSCMPSIGKFISGHNKKILKGVETTPPL